MGGLIKRGVGYMHYDLSTMLNTTLLYRLAQTYFRDRRLDSVLPVYIRRRSAAARRLRLWVRIPPGARISVS